LFPYHLRLRAITKQYPDKYKEIDKRRLSPLCNVALLIYCLVKTGVSNKLNTRFIKALRKACEYAVGQWNGFYPKLEDGRIEISNIKIENLICPVALVRKNYLFKGSEKAAQRAAIIYSIVATAHLHGKNPREYIKELLEKLPSAKNTDLRSFLPY